MRVLTDTYGVALVVLLNEVDLFATEVLLGDLSAFFDGVAGLIFAAGDLLAAIRLNDCVSWKSIDFFCAHKFYSLASMTLRVWFRGSEVVRRTGDADVLSCALFLCSCYRVSCSDTLATAD